MANNQRETKNLIENNAPIIQNNICNLNSHFLLTDFQNDPQSQPKHVNLTITNKIIFNIAGQMSIPNTDNRTTIEHKTEATNNTVSNGDSDDNQSNHQSQPIQHTQNEKK